MEQDLYPPSAETLEGARIKSYDEVSKRAAADPEDYWAREASELEWFEPWTQVLDWQPPFAQWFLGARCNIVHNCLDRHLKTWRRNKLALIWESETGEHRNFSYFALHREVTRFANVLKSLGARKGDRITVYMPRIPEQLIAILACARIGAIHSVIFGGFSVDALHERIMDAESRLVITADGGFMNEKVVPLKEMVDQAVRKSPSVEAVLVVRRVTQQRPDLKIPMEQGRDFWYDELAALPIATRPCPCEPMDSEDPLFILYTSGTTGRPKGILHVHGGYMVGAYSTFKNVFDIRDEDRYWCTADAGWVTGHTYIVYAPFLTGATQVMYEGAPSFPYPDRWWSIISRLGVNILYSTPTAIRGLMRYGEAWPDRHDLSSLRLLGSVGEPINPEAWRWFHRVIGKERCPIMDTWWQTETGSFMISPLPCVALKPGTATRPLPGIDMDVVDEHGNPVPQGQDGYLVIRKPWPSMLRTLYKNPDLYKQVYWSKVPGVYTTGDSARKDEDGYIWVVGRMDDVIKVSGYRLGTAEVESALVSHPAVAEAACIGLPHEVKGNSIKAFVVLREGHEAGPELEDELRDHVGTHLSKIARPDAIEIVDKLPKTRSGKIMRRLLKAKELGQPIGDTSTLED
ncbi:MAG: acetate--CoA ligase [Candidatus Eremiobacteraeota bacterium]|nr:acetate--CoA ligase [Candidatus Eremiobacteraeota bacterium]MCW5867820.1 acetate--CoA ligase [Candidatus Eremiobacteraeota bacterium]